ncbi:MAG: FecR domain-containing protein [Sideroxyarcus sp.]
MKIPALIIFGILMAQNVCAQELFGTVEDVSGNATMSDANGTSVPVTSGLKIFTGQSIQTANDGEVHIVTEDSGLIALRPNSSFRIERYQSKGEPADEVVFSLFKGALRSITGWIAKRNPSAYRLNTPTATIGVRGTDHETTVIEAATENDLPGTFDTVNEGVTVLQTARGEIEVHPGEHAFAPRDQSIAPAILARHPGFWKHRAFKIEERIQQRKASLMQHVQRRLDQKAEGMHPKTGGQKPEIGNHREAVKKRIEKRKPRERRIP